LIDIFTLKLFYQLKSILFLSFFLFSQSTFACSCEQRYFCEFVKHEESDYKMVAVRAKVLDGVSYEDDTMAAYLEVLEEYRDDVNVRNFIKIYGDYHDKYVTLFIWINLREKFFR
jgi:hypothetical protein